jgi:pimeloyl-ACP methyl ester carboxylesterase
LSPVKRLVLGLLLLVLPASAQAASAPSWNGRPTGIFRTARYDRGEWIYTNGIGQALGANTDGLHRTDYYKATDPQGDDPTHINRDIYNAVTYDAFGAHRPAHNGDYQLPTDSKAYPVGTADLAEVRLAIRGDTLFVRFLWNSFPQPDAQIATLTFGDGDGTPRPWPRNARLSSPWQTALTVWGTGGTLTTTSGAEQPVAVTAGDHVTEASIPLAALPAGPWTLRGGAGLAAAGKYMDVPAGEPSDTQPGSGGPASPTNVWDLLFADDSPWTFDERHQSDELANADASADKITVDPSRLRLGTPSSAAAPRTGDMTRLFSSRWSGGDGLKRYLGLDSSGSPPPPGAPTQGALETWQWQGRLQPYGMHVPNRYSKSHTKWPLIVYLHGFANSYDEAFYEPVGLVDEADRQGYLLAAPLERGDYSYRDQGDMDVLEVIRDVERHYRVDTSRIYLMGHSMGGYGTNNVSTRHPDLFAAVAPAEGTDSIDLAGNLRNVPWFETSSLEDLDAGAQQAQKMYGALSDAGYDATLLVYDMKIHEYSSIYDNIPALFRFFAAHTLQRNPATVTFTHPAGEDRPDLGLVYDHAYWLSGINAADTKTAATVTATSDAIRHHESDPANAEKTTQVVFDPNAPSKRSIGELYSTTPASGPLVRRTDTLTISATNLAAVTVDARRARLRLGRALRIESKSDKPFTLVLVDGATTRTVAVPAGEQTLRPF